LACFTTISLRSLFVHSVSELYQSESWQR
jgi:hypothetical protein